MTYREFLKKNHERRKIKIYIALSIFFLFIGLLIYALVKYTDKGWEGLICIGPILLILIVFMINVFVKYVLSINYVIFCNNPDCYQAISLNYLEHEYDCNKCDEPNKMRDLIYGCHNCEIKIPTLTCPYCEHFIELNQNYNEQEIRKINES